MYRLIITQRFPRFSWNLLCAGLCSFLLVSPSAMSAEEPSLNNPSTLRTALPEQTLLYARIPLFSSMLGDSNHYFQGNAGTAAREELATLRTDLGTAINEALPPQVSLLLSPLVSLLTENLAGPLELAVVPGAPMPALMISGQLDLDSAELEASFTSLSQNSPLFSFQGGMSNDGSGTLIVGGMPFQFQYADNELKGLISTAPQPLESAFSGTAGLNHPMTAEELDVDPDGNGTFIWVNVSAVMSLATMMAPPEQIARMNSAGVTKLSTLSLGMGRGEDQGRLLVSGRFISPVEQMPEISNTMNFTTRGEPGLFTSLSIPTPATVQYWIETLEASAGQQFMAAMNQMEQQMGFTLINMVEAFGPEAAYFRDNAGNFSVIKIRDQEAFNTLISGMERQNRMVYSTREINGTTIHEALVLSPQPEPADLPGQGDQEERGGPAAFAANLSQSLFGTTQAYWVEENGYIIMATVPQALMDRNSMGNEVMISEWLNDNLGQDFSNSLLTLTSRADQLPVKSYYFYLSTLLTLSNITHSALDIYAFPSARMLNLDDSASLGFQLDLGPDSFRAGINYDNSLVDLVLQGNPMMQAALVGIVAAIALPAYQDYTVRARMGEIVAGVTALNAPLLTYYQQNNAFPGAEESMQMLAHLSNEATDVYMEPETGTVYVELTLQEEMLGQFLRLIPVIEGQNLTWQCEASPGMSRYAPGNCDVVEF